MLISQHASGFSFSKDSVRKLSDWLESQTSSTDLLANIEAAEKAGSSAHLDGIETLIGLRNLAEKLESKDFDCDQSEIMALRRASAFLNGAKSNPYGESRSNRRFNTLIIGLQRKYIPVCFARYQRLLSDHRSAYDHGVRGDVLQIGSILTDVKEASSGRYNKIVEQVGMAAHTLRHLDKAAHLQSNDLRKSSSLKQWIKLLKVVSGRKSLCDTYSNGGTCVVNRETINRILQDKIIKSCNIIQDNDDSHRRTMHLIVALAEQNKLTPSMLQDDNYSFMFTIAAGLKICKTIQSSVNLESLTDDLAKFAA